MGKISSGKKTEGRSGRRDDQRDGKDSRLRMGIVESDSHWNEDDSHRPNQGGGPGEVLLGRERCSQSKPEVGEILETVRQLKEQYLRYASQHEQLIQSLLKQTKESEADFLECCQSLEDQLLSIDQPET